jgi:8-oxo-dGTP diphosphatase
MTTPPAAPGQPLLARAVLTDDRHRVLLVHTTGRRPRWGLPGGIVQLNESPRAAARREIREELGLDITAGDLLAAEWAHPTTPGRRARLTLTFVGPCITPEDVARIVLQPDEVDAIEWADRDRAKQVLPPEIAVVVGFPLDMPLPTRYLESTPEKS